MFYVNSSDGVKLAVYDYNSCGRETVFMVHGWPLSHKIFEYQIQPLINRGYRVVLIDLRGFGHSDAPSCGYSYDQMAEDIYQVVCSLKLTQFTLAGFSMGGAVILRYMRIYKGFGVKRLILLAAAAPSWTQRPGYPCGVTREYANQMIAQASTDRPGLIRDFCRKQLFVSPQSEAVKDWFEDISLSASGIATVQTAISLRDEDGRRDLTAVFVPTVIIHGAGDQVVSNQLAVIQHRGIRNSRLYTLENSGHGIMYDELERFNNIFISSIEGK